MATHLGDSAVHAAREAMSTLGLGSDSDNRWDQPHGLHQSRAKRLLGFGLTAVMVLLCACVDHSPRGEALRESAALNNQAVSLRRDGHIAEAIALERRALVVREGLTGQESLDDAIMLRNLGLFDLAALSDFDEAERALKRAVEIRKKIQGSDHPDVAQALHDLANVYSSQGRISKAIDPDRESLAIREKTLGFQNRDTLDAMWSLAFVYNLTGHYSEAEPQIARYLGLLQSPSSPEHEQFSAALLQVGQIYFQEGRYRDAEALFRHSLEIGEKDPDADKRNPWLRRNLELLGGVYTSEGRFGEAEPIFQRALEIEEKILERGSRMDYDASTAKYEPLDEAEALLHLGRLYVYEGNYKKAGPLLQRAVGISDRIVNPDERNPFILSRLAASLTYLATYYSNQGRFKEAESLDKRAFAVYSKAYGPAHPDVATSLENLSNVYNHLGRTDEALSASRQAAEILSNRIGGTSVDSDIGSPERRSERGVFINNVELLTKVAGAAAAGEAFRSAQLANTSSAAQAIGGMAARFASGGGALAAIIRHRQDLAQQHQRLDDSMVQMANTAGDYRDSAAQAALQSQLDEVTKQLQALDVRIARDFPGYAELVNPKPIELAATQALLGPGEVMLVYLVGTDETWLWALRRDRAEMHRIDIGARMLTAEVAALRQRLDPELNPSFKPYEVGRAYALYRKILAPAEPLLKTANQVLVVPDGALESLPFGVLVTQPGRSDPVIPADHRRIAWLARDHALTVLPSVGALRALRQFASGAHAREPFAGIGNPVLNGDPDTNRGVKLSNLFRGPLADIATVRSLPPLPETADELRAVARTMGAAEQDLYLGERASEPLLRQAGLDRYRVLEFATHGLMSGDLQGLAEPALVLTPPPRATPENDGLLTASKIATLNLDADWVVLSACNTAASDGTPDAGGLSGLAKAFFYAGARSLLVSHWPVPSEATVKLVTSAFEALERDKTIGRAEALRRAEMAMLDPASQPEFAHPMMWAPFSLAGEGGAGRQ